MAQKKHSLFQVPRSSWSLLLICSSGISKMSGLAQRKPSSWISLHSSLHLAGVLCGQALELGHHLCFWGMPVLYLAFCGEDLECHRQVIVGPLTLHCLQNWCVNSLGLSCYIQLTDLRWFVILGHRSSPKGLFKEWIHNITNYYRNDINYSPLLSEWTTQQKAININSPRILNLTVFLMSTQGPWTYSVGGLLGGYESKPRGFVLWWASAYYLWALD